MARGDLTLFNGFIENLTQEGHNFATDTLRVGIITNVQTPVATEATPSWGDYSANEVSDGNGYTAGGITVTGLSDDRSDNVLTVDGDDIALAQNASGFTDGYWGILYNSSNAQNAAIGFIELDGPLSIAAGPLALNWSPEGIFRLTIN